MGEKGRRRRRKVAWVVRGLNKSAGVGVEKKGEAEKRVTCGSRM
jgi:hypothetical protein